MLEFELIKRYFERGPSRQAALGIGDDCALLDLAPAQSLAISSDMLVQGRHFFADVSPYNLGHKALAVNLSDLAAMGAKPIAFTLALALPQADENWLAQFSEGLFALADEHGCELIGGDTTQGPLNICITVFGGMPRGAALRRDGAQIGDDVWVSGELGGPYLAVQQRYAASGLASTCFAEINQLQPYPPKTTLAAIEKLERPQPRLALGQALRHLASSAIDLSDGLAGDLAHICERSRCSALVSADALPLAQATLDLPAADRQRCAWLGGDEYELCFSAAPENRGAIEALRISLALPITRIGHLVAGQGVHLLDPRAQAIKFADSSHQHFVS